MIGHGLPIREGNAEHGAILFDTLGHFWQMAYAPPDTDSVQIDALEKWGLEPNGFNDRITVYVPAGSLVSPLCVSLERLPELLIVQ